MSITRNKLLCGLVLAAWTASAPALTAVESLAERKAEILRIVHKKAKKALANAAQDRAFERYFTGNDAQARAEQKARIDHIALNVQRHHHADEMCLIDPDGHEISRIVGDRVAADLSATESAARFFAPGFAHPPRRVYVSPVYLSADARKWVVAYVTPIVVGADKRAILHYEHGLDRYQRALVRDLEGTRRFLVAVDRDGRVLVDSRAPVDVDERPGAHAAADYFRRFTFAGLDVAGVLREIERHAPLKDDRGREFDGAYATVEDWTLLAFEARQEDRP